MRRWSLTLTALATPACGPTPADDEPPCADLRQAVIHPETIFICSGCFSVDPTTGVGDCRGVVRQLTVPEVVAVLVASASLRDGWKTECPDRNTELLPIAEHVVDNAADYATLDDIKEAVFGGVDDVGLEVRTHAACVDEGCFGALDAFIAIDPPPTTTTCCIGPGRDGADYTCEWQAAEGVPSTCAPLAP